MTDFTWTLELLRSLIKEARATLNQCSAPYLVAKNQNSPPLGEVDGSFTEEAWVSCRDILEACRTIDREASQLENTVVEARRILGV